MQKRGQDDPNAPPGFNWQYLVRAWRLVSAQLEQHREQGHVYGSCMHISPANRCAGRADTCEGRVRASAAGPTEQGLQRSARVPQPITPHTPQAGAAAVQCVPSTDALTHALAAGVPVHAGHCHLLCGQVSGRGWGGWPGSRTVQGRAEQGCVGDMVWVLVSGPLGQAAVLGSGTPAPPDPILA